MCFRSVQAVADALSCSIQDLYMTQAESSQDISSPTHLILMALPLGLMSSGHSKLYQALE